MLFQFTFKFILHNGNVINCNFIQVQLLQKVMLTWELKAAQELQCVDIGTEIGRPGKRRKGATNTNVLV